MLCMEHHTNYLQIDSRYWWYYSSLWMWSGFLLLSFDFSINFDAIDVKIDWSILDKKLSFKILILSFFYKLNWVFAFPQLLKLPLKNWRLHFVTIDLPSGLAWNSVNMSILVLITAPWIFWKSYRNIDVGCWS